MTKVCSAVVLLSVVGLSACASTHGTGSLPAVKPAALASDSMSLTPTPLRFDLDGRFWTEQELGSKRNTEILAIRAFSRQRATEGAECPAAMIVVAESVPSDVDVVAYSAAKRSGMPPHQMDGVFSHLDGMLQLKNAVGYRIRGTLGCHPVVHMVHARDGTIGYNILLEVDPHDYALIESEILSILRSFRIPEGG